MWVHTLARCWRRTDTCQSQLTGTLREGLVSFGPSYVMSLPQEVNRLDEIITRYNITSCIHFRRQYFVYPESCCKSINVLQEQFNHVTVSLLDKLIECGVKTFVYSSSAAAYGDPGLEEMQRVRCLQTN